jgi:hypothetical protein
MKAKFDDPLTLKNGGRMLEACGPLEWDSPDATKVIVSVRIAQNNVEARGTSGDFVRPNGEPKQEWMVTVQPEAGRSFRAGPAEAFGTLTVTDPPASAPQGPETFRWQGSLTLKL